MSNHAPPRITGYDHVGIRVSDAARALHFYEQLGFVLDPDLSNERVAELVTSDGTRVNLIFNGAPRPEAHNILLDEPVKWPGYTHGAFIVPSLDSVLEWAEGNGVAITEGPVDWGRRLTCFLRDPDGNVLEFNELRPQPARSGL
ncbi:MAG TPA: VOC family protein [Allosphingosinicella sp.]|nr:VOC family protein [Allosphingosinicella sp.]